MSRPWRMHERGFTARRTALGRCEQLGCAEGPLKKKKKGGLTGAVMSRFLKSPRRLAPNQPLGYFYQPLRAPRAHPLFSLSVRARCSFTVEYSGVARTHIHVHVLARTCKSSGQAIKGVHTFACRTKPQARPQSRRRKILWGFKVSPDQERRLPPSIIPGDVGYDRPGKLK